MCSRVSLKIKKSIHNRTQPQFVCNGWERNLVASACIGPVGSLKKSVTRIRKRYYRLTRGTPQEAVEAMKAILAAKAKNSRAGSEVFGVGRKP